MLYMTIAKHISHPRCIIISDRPFKMLPFLHFNGRATSMAPIYGISLFIQVEFVGSGFADPCLFHGVNLLTFIYKSNKPASNIISTWTLQRKYQTGPIPPIPSPRLPSKFHNQTSTKWLPLCSSIYGEKSRSGCFCIRNWPSLLVKCFIIWRWCRRFFLLKLVYSVLQFRTMNAPCWITYGSCHPTLKKLSQT